MRKWKEFWRYLPIYLAIFAMVLCMAESGSRAVTAIAEVKKLQAQTCIVIDPGHGGEDGGAISCTGIPESRFNLEISLRLNDLLNLLGYPTKMVRTEDISVYEKGKTLAEKKVSDLRRRVSMVNGTPNALLVSIHQNHFTDSRYRGAQIFHTGTESSRILAAELQKAFLESVNPGSRRQEKQARGIYLMDRVNCTAILVECGFLSNPEEEKQLREPDYQKAVCCVIGAEISRFLSHT